MLHREGPLLILAGAGSGKTRVMSFRIAHLISARGVKASNILGLSFTNKAARELKERVESLVAKVSGSYACKGITLSTFHSLCVRILRTHGDRLGYDRNFTILDTGDQEDVMRQVLKSIKIDDRKFDPSLILFQISQAKNRFLSPEKAQDYFLQTKMERDEPSDAAIATASAYPRYYEKLMALNAMDFDDLLYNGVRLLEEHPDVRHDYNRKFQHILVDEYQDTNGAQFRLLKLLTEAQQNLCVVGDDDQSIYSWRGADPSHILGFGKIFPKAKTITLDQNYRSTSMILDSANAVISKNSKRHPKKLWSDRGLGEPILEIVVEDDRAESELVADEITKLKRSWGDIAILYRANAQSRLFEEALRMRKISYKMVGGMSFLERKEIKDILSYWRAIVNPSDDPSVRRIINWPARGIGKTTIQTVGTWAAEQGKPFFDSLRECPDITAKARPSVAQFVSLIQAMRAQLDATPVDPAALSVWARETLNSIAARTGLEQDHEDPAQVQQRFENIEELANGLGQMNFSDLAVEGEELKAVTVLREYLSRLALQAQDDEKDKDSQGNQVTLMTLHSSKGLEFPVVFLVGMEDGFLPHKRTIEEGLDFSEERRLCYVGITRAKDQLFLTRARTRIRYGKAVPRNPSRFLADVPRDFMITRDESNGPDLSSKEAVEKHEARVSDFLSQIKGRLGGG